MLKHYQYLHCISAIRLCATAGAIEMKNDEFWDYDRQVDLEGFSSKQLYDTLSYQSRVVTTSIGQHKDNAKQMYQKIVSQTESLKGNTEGDRDVNTFFKVDKINVIEGLFFCSCQNDVCIAYI